MCIPSNRNQEIPTTCKQQFHTQKATLQTSFYKHRYCYCLPQTVQWHSICYGTNPKPWAGPTRALLIWPHNFYVIISCYCPLIQVSFFHLALHFIPLGLCTAVLTASGAFRPLSSRQAPTDSVRPSLTGNHQQHFRGFSSRDGHCLACDPTELCTYVFFHGTYHVIF